jgi:hypothetical protein
MGLQQNLRFEAGTTIATHNCSTTTLLRAVCPLELPIERLKLEYIIMPIAATPFLSIACENSYWKWVYLRWLLS